MPSYLIQRPVQKEIVSGNLNKTGTWSHHKKESTKCQLTGVVGA